MGHVLMIIEFYNKRFFRQYRSIFTITHMLGNVYYRFKHTNFIYNVKIIRKEKPIITEQ